MDSINFVSILKVETANPYDGLVKQLFGSNSFYCYDVSKNIFTPINVDVECRINHICIAIKPYEENEGFYLTHLFLVLPVFLYRDMFFSVDINLNLRLLKSNTQLKELKFSISELFKLNNRSGYEVAKILSKRNPDYSYIINGIQRIKNELLGAFHYLISLSCSCPHKGKLEEKIKEKIESNII